MKHSDATQTLKLEPGELIALALKDFAAAYWTIRPAKCQRLPKPIANELTCTSQPVHRSSAF